MANYPKIGLIAFLNTAAFSHGLRTYTAGLASMTGQTLAAERTLSGGFAAMGDGVLRMARNTAIAAGIIGLAAVGVATKFTVDAAKAAIDAETAFAGVVKTAGNLTESYGVLNEAGIALKDTLLEMSLIKPLDFGVLSEIAAVAAQTGLSTELLAPFTDMIADLTAATDMAGDDAAQRVAQLMNIMGLFDEEADTSIENINSLGASIAELGNRFPITEAELIVITGRLAGMGKTVGMTTQDVLALGAAMLAVGVRSEAGGTAGQRVMMEMLAAVQGAQTGATFIDRSADIARSADKILKIEQNLAIKRQQIAEQTERTAESTRMRREADLANLESSLEAEQAALATFQRQHGKSARQAASDLDLFAKTAGVTATEFARMFRERPGEAMELFILGLGDAGEDAAGILKELGLADARLLRTFLQLASAGNLISQTTEASNRAWEEQIALTDEAAERYATMESIFQMLANRFNVVQIRVGDTLRPAMKQIVRLFRSLDAPGARLVSLFERRIGPAIESVAWAFAQAAEGDRAGMLAGFEAALIQAFGKDNARVIWTFARETRDSLDTISTWIRDNRPIIEGAIKGIGVLLATSGIVMWLVRIGERLLWLTSPIGLLTLGMAGLGIAWETNWLGMRDIITEFVADVTPKLETWWENTQRWFHEELKPKIEAGDWIGAGLVIMQSIEQGIQNALAAMIPLEERLRTWVGGQLGMGDALSTAIQIEDGKVSRLAPSWQAIGYEMWRQVNTGIATAIKEAPSIVDLLANAIGGGLGLEPILTDDDIRRGVEKNISWVRIGQEIGERLWTGVIGAQSVVGQMFEEFSSEGGSGHAIAGAAGRLLGQALLLGFSATLGSEEFYKAIGHGLALLVYNLIPGAGRLFWEFGKSLVAQIAAGIHGTEYDYERALLDMAIQMAKDDTLAEWWGRNFFPEGAFIPMTPAERRRLRDEGVRPGTEDVPLPPDWPGELADLAPAIAAELEETRRQQAALLQPLEEIAPNIADELARKRAEGFVLAATDLEEERRLADERAIEQAGITEEILGRTAGILQEQETQAHTHMGIVETERANQSTASQAYIEAVELQTEMTTRQSVALETTIYDYIAALNESAEAARVFVENTLGVWYEAILAMRISAETLARSLASPAGLGLPSDVPGLARGTNFFSGGLALVGERGPEVVSLPRGAKIFSNESLMNRFSMPANVSNNSTYNINIELPAGSPFETQQAASIGVREALRAVGVA